MRTCRRVPWALHGFFLGASGLFMGSSRVFLETSESFLGSSGRFLFFFLGFLCSSGHSPGLFWAIFLGPSGHFLGPSAVFVSLSLALLGSPWGFWLLVHYILDAAFRSEFPYRPTFSRSNFGRALHFRKPVSKSVKPHHRRHCFTLSNSNANKAK